MYIRRHQSEVRFRKWHQQVNNLKPAVREPENMSQFYDWNVPATNCCILLEKLFARSKLLLFLHAWRFINARRDKVFNLRLKHML